jgi:hypothetical protein
MQAVQAKTRRVKMLRTTFVVILASSLITTNAVADSTCDDAARQFSEATKVYLNDGSTAFVERLAKSGRLEADKRALGAMAQGFGQAEQALGPIQSSSVVSKKQLGARLCYLIGVLEYSNGPVFVRAMYYRGSKGVAAISMRFNTDPDDVFPKQYLFE